LSFCGIAAHRRERPAMDGRAGVSEGHGGSAKEGIVVLRHRCARPRTPVYRG
jgi:hypothetical protein